MKILSVFQSFSMGGMQNRFLQLLRHAEFQKWEHHILSLDGNFDLLSSSPIPLHPIRDFPYKKHCLWHNLKAFRTLYRQGGFDLVQTHNWATIEAVIANTPLFIPHLHNEDGFGSDESQKLNPKRNFIRRLFLKGKHLCVPSQTLETIATELWKVKNLHYIPNGIEDYGDYEFTPLQDKIILGTACILRPEKNLFRFIHFIKNLLEHNLAVKGIIIGDGMEKEKLMNYCEFLNLSPNEIEFLGYHPTPQKILKDIDVFVLTSDTEQQPYSVLEAMNLTKPIISTNVGDVLNMVSPENQDFIVADEYFDNPSAELLSFIRNKNAQKKIGIANRSWQLKYYDIHKMYDERIALIKKLKIF